MLRKSPAGCQGVLGATTGASGKSSRSVKGKKLRVSMRSEPTRLLQKTRPYWRACWSSRYESRPRHGRAKSGRRRDKSPAAPLGFPNSGPVVRGGNCENLRHGFRISGGRACGHGRGPRGEEEADNIPRSSRTIAIRCHRSTNASCSADGGLSSTDSVVSGYAVMLLKRNALEVKAESVSRRRASHSPPASSYLGGFQ